MSSTSENETEILLGNRHLLAIFFVLAVLLGIAFTGGYMVGKNSSDKRPAVLAASGTDAAARTGGETIALPPSSGDSAESAPPPPPSERTHTVQPPREVTPAAKEDAPLGARKRDPAEEEDPPPVKPAPKPKPTQPLTKPAANFGGPQSGQTFLQVAAVGHTEANALADVLGKKGFHAHAVAKPGSADIYRVLIGPLRDASELAATRDSLRNAGFTKIFAQKY